MSWRALAVFGSASVVIYFMATLFIPDTPSWLITKGKEEKARKNMSKLRPGYYNVEQELQQIISTAMNK